MAPAVLEAQWVVSAKSTSLDEVWRLPARRTASRRARNLELVVYWCVFFGARSTTWEFIMNWDQIEGNWKQLKGKARQQWGKLTDDDFDQVQGQREQLVGRVQERYGIAREEAERQVKQWETGL
jgi:uncharacterized protein YjbJ (UPF0337 family)